MGARQHSGVFEEYIRTADAQRSPEWLETLAAIDRQAPRKSVTSYALLHRVLAADDAELDAIEAALDARCADGDDDHCSK